MKQIYRMIVVAGISVIIGTGCKPKEETNALMFEAQGNFNEAQSQWGAALLKVTEGAKIPDVNLSKVFAADVWKKEMRKNVDWIYGPRVKLQNDFFNAVQGIQRCSTKVNIKDNTLDIISVKPITIEQFRGEWFRNFFGRNVMVDSSHGALADNAFSRNCSVINITSLRNYTYNIALVNKATGRRTDLELFPESSLNFLVAPGDYLIVCRSKVQFDSGTMWYSRYDIIPVTIPQTSSLLTCEVRTKVDREKK